MLSHIDDTTYKDIDKSKKYLYESSNTNGFINVINSESYIKDIDINISKKELKSVKNVTNSNYNTNSPKNKKDNKIKDTKDKYLQIQDQDNKEMNIFDIMRQKKQKISQKNDNTIKKQNINSDNNNIILSLKENTIKETESNIKYNDIDNDGDGDSDSDNKIWWKNSKNIPYLALVEIFEQCEQTTKRLEIIDIISNFLQCVIRYNPNELQYCIQLMVNQISPAYEGIEQGIGDQTILRALVDATGSNITILKKKLQECGDLGTVAQLYRVKQKVLINPETQSVKTVFLKFKEIATSQGNKSAIKKRELIQYLLVSSIKNEPKYIVRGLQGNLRIHLALPSVLKALAKAMILKPPINIIKSDTPMIFYSNIDELQTSQVDDIDEDNESAIEDSDIEYEKDGKKRVIKPKVRTQEEELILLAQKSTYCLCKNITILLLIIIISIS